MSQHYERVAAQLRETPRSWLITGVAGFIGSNLLERLLELDQAVVGLDNFATGCQQNLDEVRSEIAPRQWQRFRFIAGDIRDLDTCRTAARGCDIVLHQAALGSVPRSMADPITSNSVNIDGFLNMLVAARDAEASRFVYAASSSSYGAHEALPKVEDRISTPLSPYAVTKLTNELYATVFADAYGFPSVGLRYFNVFGPRQAPNGSYAAVIPKWTASLLRGDDVYVNGDGKTSRDFCFIDNVVQANLLAATAPAEACDEVYNVAVGDRTSLNQLLEMLRNIVAAHGFPAESTVVYRDFRAGDVRHSEADISKARRLLGYRPTTGVRAGLDATMPWYVRFCRSAHTRASVAAE